MQKVSIFDFILFLYENSLQSSIALKYLIENIDVNCAKVDNKKRAREEKSKMQIYQTSF